MSTALGILRAVCHYQMFQPGDKVLVAVSGGPDSVAMLHALHTYSQELCITLHIAHFNHSLRGNESDEDESFVSELACALKLPITVEHGDVKAFQRDAKLSLEEAARELRYNFLHKCALETHSNKIAVGHTADDRVETVLLNVLRGTGIEGLAAMRSVSGCIVRPLIETWRAEILEYLQINNLSYRLDSSNLDTSYTRNRIRLELMPLLEREYNTQTKAALLRLAKVAERYVDVVEQCAIEAALAVEYEFSLDARLLGDLPMGLAAEVIRNEIRRAKGNLKDVELEHIDQILAAISERRDFAIELPEGNIVVEKQGHDIRIGPRQAIKQAEPFDVELAVPGRTYISALGITIQAELLDTIPRLTVRPNVAILDADKVRGKLRIRNLRSGDRIVPFGMQNSKKLQDVFVDKKIPIWERCRAAVITDDEKILWAVGVVASDSAKVTDETKHIIRLVAVHN
jgi:tRNA(Ile)-lysidine synthase